MTHALPQPRRELAGPAAWRADELDAAEWLHEWTPGELAELEGAAASVRAAGRDLASVGPMAFPLDEVGRLLSRLRNELLFGRGFVLLRGLDPDRLGVATVATILWGLGVHLGRPVPQNALGDLLGHVRDLGRSSADPTARIYQTAERQGFHTDSADLVGLLCLQRAAEGGRSAVASCAAIHNVMLGRCPDLLGELFAPFHTDHRGEQPAGALPFFRAPILSWLDERLSVLYQRRYIESAQRFSEVPQLTARQIAALDAFDAAADDPAIHLTMDLRPGDVQFIHNHQLVHDRTAFRDDPAAGRRRHLLRLWLCPEVGRALPPWFAERLRSVDVGRRGGIELPPGVQPRAVLDPRSS